MFVISFCLLVQSNLCFQFKHRGYPPSVEKETVSASDEDAIADVMEQHDQFVNSMQSRSAKLQVILNEVMLVVNWIPLLLLYISIFFIKFSYSYTAFVQMPWQLLKWGL